MRKWVKIVYPPEARVTVLRLSLRPFFEFGQVSVFVPLPVSSCQVKVGCDMIKARAHKGGVRIGKSPKKLASICCP
jgi:hypothetical protein